MPQTKTIALREEWGAAWQSPRFRRRILTGLFFAIAVASLFPVFFQAIEKREGIVLNDRLLNALPAHDVSIPILLIVWVMTALTLVRCIQGPDVLLTFLWTYIVLSLFRMLTITMVPLNAPANLIGLADPLSNAFYGAKFVTKDLFFSGHTSAMFLMFCCLPNKYDKVLALTATVLVGSLLLVQHVHYSLDVLTAPLFTWIIYRLTSKMLAR